MNYPRFSAQFKIRLTANHLTKWDTAGPVIAVPCRLMYEDAASQKRMQVVCCRP